MARVRHAASGVHLRVRRRLLVLHLVRLLLGRRERATCSPSVGKALEPGGRFLLDLMNRDWLLTHPPQRTWTEREDGGLLMEEVSIDLPSSRVSSRQVLIEQSGGARPTKEYDPARLHVRRADGAARAAWHRASTKWWVGADGSSTRPRAGGSSSSPTGGTEEGVRCSETWCCANGSASWRASAGRSRGGVERGRLSTSRSRRPRPSPPARRAEALRERGADVLGVEAFLPGGEWRDERGAVFVHERLRSTTRAPRSRSGVGSRSLRKGARPERGPHARPRARAVPRPRDRRARHEPGVPRGHDALERRGLRRSASTSRATTARRRRCCAALGEAVARLRVPGHVQRQVVRRAVPRAARDRSTASGSRMPRGSPRPAASRRRRRWRGAFEDCRLQTLERHVCRPAPRRGRAERRGPVPLPRLRSPRRPVPAHPRLPPQPARRHHDGRDPENAVLTR